MDHEVRKRREAVRSGDLELARFEGRRACFERVSWQKRYTPVEQGVSVMTRNADEGRRRYDEGCSCSLGDRRQKSPQPTDADLRATVVYWYQAPPRIEWPRQLTEYVIVVMINDEEAVILMQANVWILSRYAYAA